MISYEDVQEIIRREVAKQLTAILVGKAKDAAKGRESIESLYPNAPTIENRPVMHPYGLKSRAKDGTTAVVGVQGNHAANRIVLGHRDDAGPEPDAIGAVILYDAFGNSVHLKDGKIVVTLGGENGKLELGAGATKAAAREGDSVDAGSILVVSTPGGGPCTVTYVAAGGVAPPLPPGAGLTALNGGKITSGSGKVTITD